MRQGQNRFRPSVMALEGRLVLSAASSAGATNAILSAFQADVLRGVDSTLVFDFGPGSSPVAPGAIGVGTALFSAKVGFGWSGGRTQVRGIRAVDRHTVDPLTRDFVETTGRRSTTSPGFGVEVPDGLYDVTFVLGDPARARGPVSVEAGGGGHPNGGPVANGIATGAGETRRVTLRAIAENGQLDLGLVFPRGSGGALDAVEIRPVLHGAPVLRIAPTLPPGSGRGVKPASLPAPVPVVLDGGTPDDPTIHLSGVAVSPAHIVVGDPPDDSWILGIHEPPGDDPNQIVPTPIGPGSLSLDGIIYSGPPQPGQTHWGSLTLADARGQVTLDLETPGSVSTDPADAPVPTRLDYTVRSGTGVYRAAKGSGTVELALSMTSHGPQGVVQDGKLSPTNWYGTAALTFPSGR